MGGPRVAAVGAGAGSGADGVASADPDLPARHLAAVFAPRGAASPAGVKRIAFDATWFAASGPDSQPPLPIHADGEAICRVFSTCGRPVRRALPVTHAAMAARIATDRFPAGNDGHRPVMICALGLGGSWGLRAVLATFLAGGSLGADQSGGPAERDPAPWRNRACDIAERAPDHRQRAPSRDRTMPETARGVGGRQSTASGIGK